MTTTTDLQRTAQALAAEGKGLLAADETVRTLTRRFDALRMEATADSRRTYREMLFSTLGIVEFVSGVILQEETLYQRTRQAVPMIDLLSGRGIIPGIKVDEGVTALAGSHGEHVTQGLDGLRERLDEYRSLGARFAKWHAAITISDTLPTTAAVRANAHALARFAALCQECGLVPVVEAEVLMHGAQAIDRCEEVTGRVLDTVFDELDGQRVALEAVLLRTNMVLPGAESVRPATVREVAQATVRCVKRHVPAAVPGIVFLAGGQSPLHAMLHLSAINQLAEPKPWALTFAYGHALQDEALTAWHGRDENISLGQQAFYHRLRCASAATLGKYTAAMESEPVVA